MHSKTRKEKSFLLKKKEEEKGGGGRDKKNTRERKKYFFKSVFNTVTEIVFYYKSPFHSTCGYNINSLTWLQVPFGAVAPGGKVAPL